MPETTCPTCRATIAPNVDKHTCPRKPRRDWAKERQQAQQRLFGIGRDGV